MANSVTVSYGRKRTDKLGDGSFDAVELGASLTVEVEDPSTSLLSVQESLQEALKAQVDKQFNAIPKHDLAVIKAVPQQQPMMTKQTDTLAQDAPPRKPLDWLEGKIQQETANIQQRMQALPGENITGGSYVGDEYGTPTVAAIKEGEAVMYTGCRVFDSKVDIAKNGNEFGVIRVGKRGPDGIPGQYTNARTFDGALVNKIRAIREGDMVDVYGYFKPWTNNPEKFDLELQKVERSE